MHNENIKMIDALRRMRELTSAGVPFSFKYYKTDGSIKEVKKAVLRKGYRNNQSKKSKILIGYTDLNTNAARQFHRACLIEFNNNKIVR